MSKSEKNIRIGQRYVEKQVIFLCTLSFTSTKYKTEYLGSIMYCSIRYFEGLIGYVRKPGTECADPMPGSRYQYISRAEEKCNEEPTCVGVHVLCGKFHTFQLCSGNGLSEGSKQENCAEVVFVKPCKIETS